MNLQNTKRIKHGEIPHGDLVKMTVMLPANGRTDFADIDLCRDDLLFKELPGIRMRLPKVQMKDFCTSKDESGLFTAASFSPVIQKKMPFLLDFLHLPDYIINKDNLTNRTEMSAMMSVQYAFLRASRVRQDYDALISIILI